MALHNGDTALNNNAQGTNTNNTNTNTNTTTGVDPLSLGLGLFANTGVVSEYMKKFLDRAKEVIPAEEKVLGNTVKYNIYKIDRTSGMFSNMMYSYVIFTLQATNTDKVFYTILLLEATGKEEPQTLTQKLEAVMSRQTDRVWVAADAFDQELMTVTKDIITADKGITEDKLKYVKGMVVPYELPAEDAGVKATAIAKKHLLADYLRSTKLLSVLNIKLLNGTKDEPRIPKLDTVYLSQPSLDPIGKTIRADFKLNLKTEAVRNQQQQLTLNSRAGTVDISTNLGYVEFVIANRAPVAALPGVQVQQQLVGKPIIIVNANDGIIPEADIILLNLVNSTIFADQSHLAALLVNYNRDFGVLNYICNIEQNKTGHGAKLKLKSGKYTQEQIIEHLYKLVDLTPHIAVETEVYGPNFNMESPFAALGLSNKNSALAANANEYIVKIAEAMTGHQFTNRQVALQDGIVIPTGYWVDKNGIKRDLREFDLITVIENTNDPVLINKWILSNAPASITGQDPFALKLEVLNALVPNAILEGKAVRTIINPAFLSELVSAVTANGFNPRTSGGIQISGISTDMFSVAKAFAGGLAGVHFGQPVYNNPTISTFDVNMYGGW